MFVTSNNQPVLRVSLNDEDRTTLSGCVGTFEFLHARQIWMFLPRRILVSTEGLSMRGCTILAAMVDILMEDGHPS